MNPFKPLGIFTILVVALFSACSEKDDFEPYLKGDIVGYAFCFDEYGNKLENFSGIKVITEPGRQYTAVTDKNGRYELKSVINGTYNLSFEKEDFGTMKIFGVQHLGGSPTIIGYYSYYEGAPFIFKNITTRINEIKCQGDSLLADFTFSGEYRPFIVYLRLSFSLQENFDLSSVEATKNIEVWDLEYNYQSYYNNVSEGLPFTPGETVYGKAAIYSDNLGAVGVLNLYSIRGIDTYFDSETHTTVYPNLSNETYEFSFTMP
jgi:hypothetical protein